MNETGGSITVQKDGFTEESMLFTYSPEEMEQNIINRENSERIFSPEFIPYYVGVARKYNLTDKEALTYGFIRFYMTNANTGERFYFTNEQIARVVGASKRHIEDRIMPSLKKKGLIKVSHKIKAGGGKVRFVTQVCIPTTEGALEPRTMEGSEPRTMEGIIENKINKNRINRYTLDAKPSASASFSYKEFLDFFNTTVGTMHRGDTKSKGSLKARLREGYKPEEIKQAVINAKKDAHLMGENPGGRRYLTPEYILRSDKLDNWLNSKKAKTQGWV